VSDLAAKDFHVASCQATLFTPEEAVSAVKLIKGLLPSWVSRFDQEPMVLPFGGEVPREIPRLILQSKDGARRCEIASERINLLWRKVSPDAPEPTLAEFYGDASLQLVEYQQFLGARVGRIAAVINRYAEHPEPARFLTRHFCDRRWGDAPLNRPESLELHAHKQFALGGRFIVNSWVRNRTGTVSLSGGSSAVVMVEQDLNTLHEEVPSRSYSDAEIRAFFDEAAREFEVIMRLYYPAEKAT